MVDEKIEKKMIHIVMDTSGIGLNRSFKRVSFKTLEKLVDMGHISIHIPYIVRREFETQQYEYYLNKYNSAFSAVSDLCKTQFSDEIYSAIHNIKNELSSLKDHYENYANNVSREWFNKLKVKFYEIDELQAKKALEAYFMGTPPLTNAKERADIPDSFICRAIEKIKENHDELVLIVQDKKIINTFKDIPTYTIHENIDAFINTANIQEILIVEDKLETLKKYENVIAQIQSLEFEHHVIENYLASHIGDTLIGKTIESRTIPSDNNDATISQFGEAKKIELNFKNHTYYGDNQIGIQFKLITDVYVDFYIYKADYYMLDDDVSFSIDDFNNHYFEAETELFIEVTGIVLIKFDPISDLQADYDDLTEENFEDYLSDSYIGNSEIHIESIDTIKVVDSN